MDSVFNSGVPHIGEKILKCLDIKSIMSFYLASNPELKSYMDDNNLYPALAFSKNIKAYLYQKKIQKLWLPLIEIIDEKSLWNPDVKHQVYLCMIHQEIHFHSISKIPCSSWDMDEQ